jgi:hypothetical protein
MNVAKKTTLFMNMSKDNCLFIHAVTINYFMHAFGYGIFPSLCMWLQQMVLFMNYPEELFYS